MYMFLNSITRRVDLAMSVCPFLLELIAQLKSYSDETFQKVVYLLQVVYKSERSDNYIL